MQFPLLRTVVLASALAIGVAAQPALGTADNPDIRGWAFIGKNGPIVDGTVTVRTPGGRLIPGLRARTGPDGSFIIDTEGTPRLAMRWAEVSVSGGWVQGYRKGMRLKSEGPLYSRVNLTGPAAGLVYVTPVSSLSALLVRNERWSIARADRMSRKWWGLPDIPQSAFGPWRDGGASTQYSTRYIDPKAVLADAQANGGLTGVINEVRAKGENGRTATYGSTQAGNATNEMERDPWGVVGQVTRACTTAQSPVPGLGIAVAAVQASLSPVRQESPCGLDKGIAQRLDAMNSQMSDVNSVLVAQSQEATALSQQVRGEALVRSQQAVDDAVAAILTIDQDARLLAALVQRYTSPRSPDNPDGLDMTLEQLVASDTAEAKTAVAAIRAAAANAYGPRLAQWQTAYEQLSRAGMLLPGGPREPGVLRAGWNAILRDQGASSRSPSARLATLSSYYRSLNALLAMQQIDAWRSEGVPEDLITQRISPRGQLDQSVKDFVASPARPTSAEDTLLLSGWASLGDDMPLVGARVVFTDANGTRIPGLEARTGLSGEFTVEASRNGLPRTLIAHAGTGTADGNGDGRLDASERVTGWLRGPVDLDGPEAGLAYLTPISTVSLALVPRYRTYERASARVRFLLRMPVRSQSAFEPWEDGGARMATSGGLIDPKRLLNDITRDGGIQGWIDEVKQRDRESRRANYRPRTRAQEQSLGGFLKKTAGVMKKIAPGLQVVGAVWGVIADQAKTCNPGQSVVPGLGPVASWMQKQGVVQQDPACQIPGQINSLSTQLNSRLDTIQSELGQIKQLLVAQSAQFARIEGVVLQSASTNAAATISNSIAAIQTAQERRLLLVNLVATFTAPRTPANVQGLGMTLDEIYASSDPAAVRAAAIINRQAERAVPSNVSGWDIVPTRLQQPGVLIPGYGSDGILQLAWKATWASRSTSGANYEDELREFSEYVDYFRNLWFLYGVQEIDSLRSDGLPGELVEQQVMARAPFDDILESLIPDTTDVTYGVPECPEVITGDITCIVPANSAGRTTTSYRRINLQYSVRVRLTDTNPAYDPRLPMSGGRNPAQLAIRACAAAGPGVNSARLDTFVAERPRHFFSGWATGSSYESLTVGRCDLMPPGNRPSAAPWPPRPSSSPPRLDQRTLSLPIFAHAAAWWTDYDRQDRREVEAREDTQALLAAPGDPVLISLRRVPWRGW